jgi:hypothetical protein
VVPFGDQGHAVGIGKHEKSNHVLADVAGLPIFSGDQIVGELDQVLSRGALGGVQASVYPDDDFPFLGQTNRLLPSGNVTPGRLR